MKKRKKKQEAIHPCKIELHHLPLSYIEIPVFGSIRKGNLHENFVSVQEA